MRDSPIRLVWLGGWIFRDPIGRIDFSRDAPMSTPPQV